MEKYRIKKPILYIGLMALIGVSTLGIYSLDQKEINKEKSIKKEIKYEYNEPVINTKKFLNKPFINEKVNILKNYYEQDVEEAIQENSILYFEETYIPNSGIIYGGVDNFDITAILDGTVKSIKNDNLIGNVIEIEHDFGIISIYQSISEIKVKEGSIVNQGDIIAKSGESSINKDLKSHLLFELIVDGEIVNPENYYGKEISKIKD